MSAVDPAATIVRAPAKLTVSLRITGVRPDGYHELEAEMCSLDLADELSFSPGDGLELVAEDTSASVSNGPDNLVLRALQAVGRQAHVRVVKRIPLGGGLGGGSTDAAAVLRWAGVSDPGVAVGIGADVPFCVVGGRASVHGIGEIVRPLPFVDQGFHLLLPPFGVSTVAVYRAWDALGGPTAPEGDEWPNDLTQAAIAVEPRLRAWRDCFAEAVGCAPVLAGSGSTWFAPARPGSAPPASELWCGAERARVLSVRAVPRSMAVSAG
jgi:4-diphosphocytidyl-2-C-methyl-D-erythritol kinase